MNALALARGLEGAAKNKRLSEALDDIAAAYYEEYTDATEFDAKFDAAFREIFDLCFPSGEDDDGREYEDFARKR